MLLLDYCMQWCTSNSFLKHRCPNDSKLTSYSKYVFFPETTDSQSETEASPEKRPRLLKDSHDRPDEISRSKQKSRRRCFQCQTKLELVQQELGSCRCGKNWQPDLRLSLPFKVLLRVTCVSEKSLPVL